MNLKKSLGITLAALSLCACHKQEAPSTTIGSSTGLASAEKTSFDEVTSKLDKGGNFYLYLSTEQTVSDLSAKMGSISNMVLSFAGTDDDQRQTYTRVFDFVDGWLKDSGVEEISGVGMSSIARDPGFYYNKVIVHHYPDKNGGVIWSMFGKEAHPLHDLDLLPETTGFASFSDLDVPLVWSDLEKRMEKLNIPSLTLGLHQWPEQFRKMTGLEFDAVLNSLGGDYGIIITLDPQKMVSVPMQGTTMDFPNPGMAIVAKVKSDVIFDRIDQLGKGNPLVVRVDKSDLKMRTMTIPLPLPVDLRPSVARSGDLLILSTSDTMVEDILAVKAGKKKSFKSTAEYARLSQGIPSEGNHFSLVTDEFMQTVMQLQQQTLTNQGKMNASQVQTLQHLFNNATNLGSYYVGANGPEGWEAFNNGSQSIGTMAISGVAGVVVAAAVGVPAYIKAHPAGQNGSQMQNNASAASAPTGEAAQYNRILRNLRLLQAAKQKWAEEKGKTDGDAVTMEDLAPYLTGGPITPVVDEEYNPQPVGARATAKLAHDLNGHAAGMEISAPLARKKKKIATE